MEKDKSKVQRACSKVCETIIYIYTSIYMYVMPRLYISVVHTTLHVFRCAGHAPLIHVYIGFEFL